ncbi:MAG: translation initiation factor IF-2 [Gemmatimonadota bacterium]|nr:translation initiation factor IF-2 [Gemmatimonadota bacterium]
MPKRRIYELAREYNVSSDALVAMLRDLKYDVKSHMSVMDDKMILDVNLKIEDERLKAREDQDRKRKMSEKTSQVAKEPKTTGTASAQDKKFKRKRGGEQKQSEAPQQAQPQNQPDSKPKVSDKAQSQGDKGKRRRSKKKRKVDKREVEASVRRTLAEIDSGKSKRRRRRDGKDDESGEIEETNVIRVPEFISAGELAEQMNIGPNEIVSKCLELGLMVTINQRLDMTTIMTVADEYGFEVQEQEEFGTELIEAEEEEIDESELEMRPPVVTIMGHVDHGKTSLLDYIRTSNVIAGEAGGITQHIGAYEVELGQGMITFLDTPGHEAFSAMRARGAQVTDIIVLVVAADDAVMPQTVEAIDHAKAAEVPVIVAMNKMDLPGANPNRIKEQLSSHGLLTEDWGGDIISCEVSAINGDGVDHLLEMILLQAELLDLKASPIRRASGVVVEAEIHKGRGTLATVLIQQGTLKKGEPFISGHFNGRVRAMLDERGHKRQDAGPSTPVQIMGFNGMPQVGDAFAAVESEQVAREISNKRHQLKREQDFRPVKPVTLEDIFHQIQEGQIQELPLIIKGDVGGSVEALSDSLLKLANDEVKIRIIHASVGAINESDVLLAAASNAIIIGFHVRPDGRVRDLALREQVDIRLYDIIYRVIQDVTAALEGLLTPEIHETVVGVAEVREVFKIPRAGAVAGSYVQSGTITRNASVRLIRDGVVVYESTVGTLRRFKEDVREVQNGYECGITVEGYQDIKIQDLIEVYETQEIARQFETG